VHTVKLKKKLQDNFYLMILGLTFFPYTWSPSLSDTPKKYSQFASNYPCSPHTIYCIWRLYREMFISSARGWDL